MSKRRRRRNRFVPDSRPMYWQAEDYNRWCYLSLLDDLQELAMTRFKWVNLPASCDARYLEWTLLTQGAATIAHPKGKPESIVSLKAVMQDAPNMYDNPKRWRAIGQTGKTDFMCDWTNGCFIYDNPTRYPLQTKLMIYARDLADIMQVKRINRFHMRMPLAITGAQEKELDLTNFYKQVATGEPVTLGYNSLLTDVSVTPVMPNKRNEYVGDYLQEEWKNTWDAVYRLLGIDSLPYKGERMIEDEVSSTMEPTQIAALGPLESRRAAVRKFNMVHGTDIDVVWNSDIRTHNYDLANDLPKRYAVMDDGGDVDAAV